MEESCVVEPYHFTGSRVFCDRWANILGPQNVTFFPLSLNMMVTAILLYASPIGGIKDGLPWKANSCAKVSDIHHLLLREALSDLWVDPFKHFSTVNNRRLSSLLCRCETEKEDFQRPTGAV